MLDKWLHVLVSLLLSLFSPSIAALAGVAKEIYDAVVGGDAEAGDLLAEGVGILLGVWLNQ